ncbi:hypothetical protein WR25_23831 [Diploscapter pachys]|uniref:ILCR1 Ig-like domain-containing protein n=1 Tax=Diploscapter pachys TaxID=2018661 RepID=A0A2A2J8F4_9BILA|nr:hypothetical protein WR25_23831 [Diploscapter pachys]
MRWTICRSTVFLIFLLYCEPNRGWADATSKSCTNSPILSCEIIDGFAGDLLTDSSIEDGTDLVPDNQTAVTTTTAIDWGRFKPIGLRTFVLYKTDPRTLDLSLQSSVRWRFPLVTNPQTSHAMPHSILGFIVRINSTALNATKTYLTRLEQPVDNISMNLSSVEFFVELGSLFLFNETYSIEVSFYPEGKNGRNTLIREAIKQPEKGVCGKATQDIAKSWVPSFGPLTAHEVTADVEVEFLPAPPSLCITRYSLYIQSTSSSRILDYVMVNATGNETRLRHIFKSMPREEKLMIKLLAAEPSEKQCVCTHCHCITVKSNEFIIPKLVHKDIYIPTIPTISDETDSTHAYLIFLTLLFILAILLAIFVLIVLLCSLIKKNRKLRKSINILTVASSAEQKPIIDYQNGKSNKYLLLASPEFDLDMRIVKEFANLLRNSNHTLLYEKFDMDDFCENVYRWYTNAISIADRILIVHCQPQTDPRTLSIHNYSFVEREPLSVLSRKIAIGTISPLDNRVIHINLRRYSPILYSEIIYNIPRDIHLLAEILEIPFSDDWTKLENYCEPPNYRLNASSKSLPIQHAIEDEVSERSTEISWADYRHPLQMSTSIRQTIDSGMHSGNSNTAETASEYDIDMTDSDDHNTQIDSGIQYINHEFFFNLSITQIEFADYDNQVEKR